MMFATLLALVSPASTSAKPACMKITRTADSRTYALSRFACTSAAVGVATVVLPPTDALPGPYEVDVSVPSPLCYASRTAVLRLSRGQLTHLCGVAVGPLGRLEQVAAGAHGADGELHRRDAAAQPQHVDVERVPPRRAFGPARLGQRLAAHDRAEPFEQGGHEPGLHRRQRHPARAVPKDAVGVELGRRLGVQCTAAGNGGDAGPDIAVLGRKTDPVFETIDGLGRLHSRVEEQEPRHLGNRKSVPPISLLRPAYEDDVHIGNL